MERKSKYKIEEHSGKTLGKWRVLSFSHYNDNRQYWNCKCECGIERAIRADHLVTGHTKGCRKCMESSNKGSTNPNWKGGELMGASLLASYRFSAKRRNLPFNMTIKDIEEVYHSQDGKCRFTGVDLTFPKTSKGSDYTASIDRIDSSKGYNKDNIQLVYKSINIMKMALPDDEFIRLCTLVHNHVGI
jgi:hypothetical protein